jgi:hypothetical protein
MRIERIISGDANTEAEERGVPITVWKTQATARRPRTSATVGRGKSIALVYRLRQNRASRL